MPTRTLRIDSGWEVAQRIPAERDLFEGPGGEETWIPARVPGAIHLDLVRAGVIQDPFHRLGEWGCRWVDEADWTWRTTFTLTNEQLAERGRGRHFLVFHGIDTVGRVLLNGKRIAETNNFFVPVKVDVTEVVHVGANEIRVEIDSALLAGRQRASTYLGDGTSERGRPHYFNFAPRAFVRKPQYMFGWDWGPELISAGLHGAVELVTVPVAEIVEWNVEHRFTGPDTVDIDCRVTVAVHDPDAALEVSAALYASGDNTPSAPVPAGEGVWTIALPTIVEQRVERWNPNGMGAQKRYLLNLRVRHLDGAEDGYTAHHGLSIGFRELELLREPDPHGAGEGFRFRVNGRDVFVRGANWIPDGSFPGAISETRLRERLTQAKRAGFNMLRVWGGGQFESDTFYALCDELGLMVWQDFPFACSSYPDDDPLFVREVRAEAVAAVRRLRHRACLAMWCGGNENLELHQGRWSGDKQAKRFLGDKIIHEVLPEVLAAEDPGRPYLPNTPYGDAGEGNAQNEDYGTAHYWNVWHAKEPTSNGDWTNYAKSNCRFSSEFGFASPAGPAAWDSCMAETDHTVDSTVSRWHDKTRKGYANYLAYIGMHFPEPLDFADLIYYGQANQAMALQFGIEHWRRRRGRCWGTLFWQLNDCWPTHSWSVVDSAGEPKLAWHAVRRSYADVLVSMERVGSAIEAHVVNEMASMVTGTLELRLLTFDGMAVTRGQVPLTVGAGGTTGPAVRVAVPSFVADSGAEVVAHAQLVADDRTVIGESFLFLAEPKDLRLPDPGLKVRIEGGVATITAERFAAFTTLRFRGMDPQPTLSDNGFHILPGTARTVRIECHGPTVEDAVLKARLHLRHL
ncbi:MAG: glycosyl hydrolase 2 galactose-binding domain-containing protein [Armatimonadota bacterium]